MHLRAKQEEPRFKIVIDEHKWEDTTAKDTEITTFTTTSATDGSGTGVSTNTNTMTNSVESIATGASEVTAINSQTVTL